MQVLLRSLLGLFVCAAFMTSGVALAQTGSKAKAKVKRVMKMKPIFVKGTPPAPVFYVLPKSGPSGKVFELKKSFVPRIVDSVERSPF